MIEKRVAFASFVFLMAITGAIALSVRMFGIGLPTCLPDLRPCHARVHLCQTHMHACLPGVHMGHPGRHLAWQGCTRAKTGQTPVTPNAASAGPAAGRRVFLPNLQILRRSDAGCHSSPASMIPELSFRCARIDPPVRGGVYQAKQTQ